MNDPDQFQLIEALGVTVVTVPQLRDQIADSNLIPDDSRQRTRGRHVHIRLATTAGCRRRSSSPTGRTREPSTP